MLVAILIAITVLQMSPHGMDRVHNIKRALNPNHNEDTCHNPFEHNIHRLDWPTCSLANHHETFSEYLLRRASAFVQAHYPSPHNLKADFEHLRHLVSSGLPHLDEKVKEMRAHAEEAGMEAMHAYHAFVDSMESNLGQFKQDVEDACMTCAGTLSRLGQIKESIAHSVSEFMKELGTKRSAWTSHAQQHVQEAMDKMLHLGEGVTLMQVLSPHHSHDLVPYLPTWPIVIFLITAAICLFFSTAFHTFLASSKWQMTFQRLDYAGIALLIGGSNVPIMYYAFFCEPFWRDLYITISTVACLCAFAVSTFECFTTAEWQIYRAMTFVCCAGCGIVPLSHMFVYFGRIEPFMWYILAMGGVYLLGASLYASRFPERINPGSFDHCGASHQLFHVCVVVAIVILYFGVDHMHDWRMVRPCSIV
jgi:channel protein (hemolysin III family)